MREKDTGLSGIPSQPLHFLREDDCVRSMAWDVYVGFACLVARWKVLGKTFRCQCLKLGPDSIIVAYVCIILFIYIYIYWCICICNYMHIYIYVCVCFFPNLYIYIYKSILRSNLFFLFPGSFGCFLACGLKSSVVFVGKPAFPQKRHPSNAQNGKMHQTGEEMTKYHPMKPYYLVVDLFWYSCWSPEPLIVGI